MSISPIPLVGSESYPAWILGSSRDSNGPAFWACLCVQAAETVVDILENGGTISLGSAGEELLEVSEGGRIDLGFSKESWPEAKILLAWVYVSIRTWGGEFILDRDSLRIQQSPHEGLLFRLAIENGKCSVTIQEADFRAGFWYLMQFVLNRIANLRNKSTGVQQYHVENDEYGVRLLFNLDGQLKCSPPKDESVPEDESETQEKFVREGEFRVSDFTKFLNQPWAIYHVGSVDPQYWFVPS